MAIIDKGIIKFNGSYNKLIDNPSGLHKFMITCKENINDSIIKKISINPKIVNVKYIDNSIIFYSSDKKEFYTLLREMIISDIIDLSISKFSLNNILLNLNSDEEK